MKFTNEEFNRNVIALYQPSRFLFSLIYINILYDLGDAISVGCASCMMKQNRRALSLKPRTSSMYFIDLCIRIQRICSLYFISFNAHLPHQIRVQSIDLLCVNWAKITIMSWVNDKKGLWPIHSFIHYWRFNPCTFYYWRCPVLNTLTNIAGMAVSIVCRQ